MFSSLHKNMSRLKTRLFALWKWFGNTQFGVIMIEHSDEIQSFWMQMNPIATKITEFRSIFLRIFHSWTEKKVYDS